MSHRKIVVDSKNYFYKVGRKFVEIRDEKMNRLATISIWNLKGISEEQFLESKNEDYYDDYYHNDLFVVHPSDVEKFIKERNL
jgi:hypothetical protein